MAEDKVIEGNVVIPKVTKEQELKILQDKAALLDIADVLPLFSTSKNTFLSWVRDNKLPANLVVRFGITIKIRKYVLEKYLMGEVA